MNQAQRKRKQRDGVRVPDVQEAAVAIAEPGELECPTNAAHDRVRLYDIHRDVGHAVCDDCGRTWEVLVTFHVDWKRYLLLVAESLLNTPTVPAADGQVIVMEQSEAKSLAATLQRLARDAPEELSAADVRRYFRPQSSSTKRPPEKPSIAASVLGSLQDGAAGLLKSFAAK